MINRQELEVKNEWWFKDDYLIEEVKLPKRDLYHVLADSFGHSLILNIIGLRRVGKSTLLKQLIGKLLADGVKSKNILYFLFDFSTQPQKSVFLDEVLATYFEEILRIPRYSPDEQVYIFLDEIQYIENWQSVLKRYYDLSNKRIKFIVTGSQSVLLKEKHQESLAGRIFDFYLPPLSFREFIKVNNEGVKTIDQFDLFNLPQVFGEIGGYNTFYGQKLVELAKEFITVGQFPEIRNFDQIERKHDYVLESVIGKVLEDCVRIFKIGKTDEFKLITYQLLNNAGSVFELKNIGREAGVSFLTLNKYLEFLKESYILEVLYKQHKSLIKRGRILKKVYTPCVNFICAINRFKASHFGEVPQAFGKIIENVVYNVLRQKYKSSNVNEVVSFWRQGEKEIDFLISQNLKQLPVEVKFSNSIGQKDLATLTNYMAEKNIKYGVVVTKNELGKKEVSGQTLYFMPYYIVLLMV